MAGDAETDPGTDAEREVVLRLPVPLARIMPRRRHQLVLTDEALAFRAGSVEQWRIRWAEIGSAQVVDVYDMVHIGTQTAHLVLDVDPVPDHPSLIAYEGRRWFLLTGIDVPALLDRELRRRLGPRHLRASTSATTLPIGLRIRPQTPGGAGGRRRG